MPKEDSRRDGARRDGLRIGGWLESFPGRRALPGRPPLVTPPPPRVPIFRPIHPRGAQRTPAARPIPLPSLAGVESPRQVRLRIAVTCLVATAVGAGTLAVLADRAGTTPPILQMTVADPATLGPMPAPSPAAKPATSPNTSTPPTSTPTTTPATTAGTPSPRRPAADAGRRPATRPAHPVIGSLRVGDTVTLAVLGAPGFGYRGLGGQSGPIAATGSRFVVHQSASTGYVSFESADHPGYFLRHRDFVLHLDRSDGSPLFRLDSAFRPEPTATGAVRLRSANYPDRFVIAFGNGLYLAEVPATRATEFSVR